MFADTVSTVILKIFSVSWPFFAVIMYAICGLAFAFYLFRIPERFLPGKFDILGRPRSNFGVHLPVLWIRDILVRIRIRGSVPLTYGPALFVIDLQNDPPKKISNFFCLLHFEGTLLHYSSKIKSHEESLKTVEI
jgi:hypothetical protein